MKSEEYKSTREKSPCEEWLQIATKGPKFTEKQCQVKTGCIAVVFN